MFARFTADLTDILLASLRLGPLFAFTPPFTLLRIPIAIRLLLVLALAATFTTAGLPASNPSSTPAAAFLPAAIAELAIGLALALFLQLAFAMIAVAGRMLDIQAGFGLAFLIDPTTKAQTPLIGAIFTYAAAAIFFATNGPLDLLAVLAQSFHHLPLGTATDIVRPDKLISFLSTVSLVSMGLVGLSVLCLFLIDLVIAMLSRTLPQMNVLVLGFQVKSLATMVLLPATLGLAAAGIVRIIRLALEAMANFG